MKEHCHTQFYHLSICILYLLGSFPDTPSYCALLITSKFTLQKHLHAYCMLKETIHAATVGSIPLLVLHAQVVQV